MALAVGSRITVSSLLVAAMLVLILGAASLLDTLKAMDRDLKVMSSQLTTANNGLAVLNKTMDSLPPTGQHLKKVVSSVEGTGTEVQKSGEAINGLNTKTGELNSMIGTIATGTGDMRGSMESVGQGTKQLDSTITALSGRIDPLAATQAGMLGEIKRMQGGVDGMNGSLAYTIRTLNYITAPPTPGGFTVRVELDKKALPPIPGVQARTDPVQVFPRNSWPVYYGP